MQSKGLFRLQEVVRLVRTPIRIRDGIMADTKKLSVEKALNKLREADARQSKSTRRDEEIDALDEEIKRMRAQRLRLEPPQRKKP
jgi:hypothetical protein